MSLSSGVNDLTSTPLICFQRRDYSALAKFLPPKHEYVVTILLSKVQKELYRKYLDNYGKSYYLHVHVVVFVKYSGYASSLMKMICLKEPMQPVAFTCMRQD